MQNGFGYSKLMLVIWLVPGFRYFQISEKIVIKFKKEKLVWFCCSFILLHILENKYGKYNLIDRYDLISPSNPMHNINFVNV